jgi:hypothetical protein
MLTDTAFRVVTSGFYGAVTEALRQLGPAWPPILIVVMLAPAIVQLLEFPVHLVAIPNAVKERPVVSNRPATL